MTIGQRISAIRKKRGIKLTELAKRSGVQFSTIANWERENHTPRFKQLIKVARELDVSLDLIVGRKRRGSQKGKFKDMTTGQIIACEMRRRGLHNKELSKMAGINVTTLSKYIAGRRLPDVLLLCSIADIFDMSLDDFVGDVREND